MILGTKKFRTQVADDMATFFSRGLDSPESLDILLDSFDDFRVRELAARRFTAALKRGASLTLGSGSGKLASEL